MTFKRIGPTCLPKGNMQKTCSEEKMNVDIGASKWLTDKDIFESSKSYWNQRKTKRNVSVLSEIKTMSGFPLSIESNFAFALVLLHFAL